MSLFKKLNRRFQRWWLHHLSFYPPFLGAGIRVPRADPANGLFEVEMRHGFYNNNFFGTHFGGSLYSMCDPFFTLILTQMLGRDYIVWDKAARIEFVAPGRGTVRARFEISRDRAQEIRAAADASGKTEPIFHAEVLDGDGNTVARVEKVVYVRRKR